MTPNERHEIDTAIHEAVNFAFQFVEARVALRKSA
jgi:hypothetical protein